MPEDQTHYSILSAWPPAKQQEFMARFACLTFHDGETIMEKGDTDTCAYFIAEGIVKVVNFGIDGQMSFLVFMKKGDCFGYYAAISGAPRTATIIASGLTKLIKVPAENFIDLVTDDPVIARNFLRTIVTIMQADTAHITALTTMTAKQRVVAQILAEQSQQKASTIALSSRTDWASHLNMTRETLSRTLNDLVTQEAILIDGNQIQIKDKAALIEYLN